MKDYGQLSRLGKLRRLRSLAENVLAQYDLNVCGLALIGTDTNLIYRVETADSERFALRVAQPGWRTLTDLESEAMWLAALARDTDICVPVVQLGREGAAVVTTTAPGIPQPHYATLMRWLPGGLLGKQLTETNLYKMGGLFAKMHQHGASWQPPQGFTTRKFDCFLSRGEPGMLFAEEQLSAYTSHSLSLFQEIRARVEAEYARLDPADLRVIHCDLWHDNIKIYRGQLCPFDFEDTVWGYRLHDMAMALLDLMEVTAAGEYARLLTAFKQGYTAHLDWPAGDMTVLQLGRLLWLNNYLARHHREWWGETAVPFYTALFERYLASGELIRPLRA
jgi:Ser/Thr protein kinase RdoA (MazF antagonist)